MRSAFVISIALCAAVLFGCEKPTEKSQERPNILLIVSDDQGISDAGFSGSRDILTPNIDKIAEEGVVFEQGYVTHSYCSPSRAGLLTGRYQQRFGHENNPPYEPENENIGLPLNETLLSAILKKGGYRTAAIGKWHLGYTEAHLPPQRGFDFWYGFSAGARSYWPTEQATPNHRTLIKNGIPVPEEKISYLTEDLTAAAMEFIKSSQEAPFFMYLAYNAPHTPLHATKEQLEKTRYLERGERSVYAAMIGAMDKGIGEINTLLSDLGLKDNTIIVFLSDNGGVTATFADNTPYRGYKGMLFEGGIRVPFCMSWKNGIAEPKVYDEMVSSLDLFPTFLSAAGIALPDNLDGKDLLPYIKDENKSKPHEQLFWRTAGGASYAVRKGDFKLTKRMYDDAIMLFDLEKDPMEIINIAAQNPELIQELSGLYKAWDSEMIRPLWTEDGHVPKTKERLETYERIRRKSTREPGVN